MDPTRFDAVAKTLAGPDRRRVLRLLAGALLGGALTLPGVREAAAACRRSRDCGRREVCRNRTCVRTCGNPVTCVGGGETRCGAGCICHSSVGSGKDLCIRSSVCPTVSCASHDECGRGKVCIRSCCPVEFVCMPKCIHKEVPPSRGRPTRP